MGMRRIGRPIIVTSLPWLQACNLLQKFSLQGTLRFPMDPNRPHWDGVCANEFAYQSREWLRRRGVLKKKVPSKKQRSRITFTPRALDGQPGLQAATGQCGCWTVGGVTHQQRATAQGLPSPHWPRAGDKRTIRSQRRATVAPVGASHQSHINCSTTRSASRTRKRHPKIVQGPGAPALETLKLGVRGALTPRGARSEVLSPHQSCQIPELLHPRIHARRLLVRLQRA